MSRRKKRWERKFIYMRCDICDFTTGAGSNLQTGLSKHHGHNTVTYNRATSQWLCSECRSKIRENVYEYRKLNEIKPLEEGEVTVIDNDVEEEDDTNLKPGVYMNAYFEMDPNE